MSDLAAFLNARLDEDEAAAKRNATAWNEAEDWVRYEWEDVPDGIAELYGRFDSARVLREVEAKRRILAEIVPHIDKMNDKIADEWNDWDWQASGSVGLLRILAAVYSDRPGYDPAWGQP